MEKIPITVTREAEKRGLGKMQFLGTVDGSQVYGEIHGKDENGLSVPTGLPCFILLKNGKTDFVSGTEALRLLGSL